VFQQRAAEAPVLVIGIDGQVGNPADCAFVAEPGGDISGDLAVRVFGDEHAVGLQPAIVGNRRRLPSPPVAPTERSQQPLHIPVDRHGPERAGRDLLQPRQVAVSECSNRITVRHGRLTAA
jgi:hypothetical protein